MSNYLYESQTYSQKYPTETVHDWIEAFKNYSAEYGDRLDIDTLTAAAEWQILIHRCLF